MVQNMPQEEDQTPRESPRKGKSKPPRRAHPNNVSTDIDDFISFVRTQGIARETTEMRLHRRAVLPGIGETRPRITHHLPDIDDVTCENMQPLRTHDVNNGQSRGTRRGIVRHNSEAVDSEGDDAYISDGEYNVESSSPRSTSPHFTFNPSHVATFNNTAQLQSKSMDTMPAMYHSPRAPLRPIGLPKQHSHEPVRWQASSRNLPPVAQPKFGLSEPPTKDRSKRKVSNTKVPSLDLNLPHRPSAPSPSVTPDPESPLFPLERGRTFMVDRDENEAVEEDPIDYIDLH